MGVERVEQGLRTHPVGLHVQGDGVGGELAHFHHCGLPVRSLESSHRSEVARNVSLTASGGDYSIES